MDGDGEEARNMRHIGFIDKSDFRGFLAYFGNIKRINYEDQKGDYSSIIIFNEQFRGVYHNNRLITFDRIVEAKGPRIWARWVTQKWKSQIGIYFELN